MSSCDHIRTRYSCSLTSSAFDRVVKESEPPSDRTGLWSWQLLSMSPSSLSPAISRVYGTGCLSIVSSSVCFQPLTGVGLCYDWLTLKTLRRLCNKPSPCQFCIFSLPTFLAINGINQSYLRTMFLSMDSMHDCSKG